MLCARCKKRPAMVFIGINQGDSKMEGLCFVCAQKLGIKPVDDIIGKIGISEEDIESMKDQISMLMDVDEEGESDDSEDDDFIQGGAATFPFLKNLFSDAFGFAEEVDDDEDEKEGKKKRRKPKSKKSKKRKNIEAYCQNLTQKAKDGKIDAVIGRDKEIDRVVQILSRRTKNNPCLIGEPGVGKTAIVEGLALKIGEGNVPFRLKKREIYLLDLTALIAGTQFRGQFESRIKGLIEEVKDDGNIILFIDEVHNLVGTGDAEGASMNAANILKPALSRGEIQVIGATTFTEYRKYIEKDSALERRFQPVTITEPSVAGAIEVLQGIKSYYEGYHRVKVPCQLIDKAVILSERYITDRFLPDKAIDLLDEACAHAAIRSHVLEAYDEAMEEIEELKSKEQELSLVDGENEIDYEQLATVRADIAKSEKKISEIDEDIRTVEVTEEDIAHVIELWVGVPATKVRESEVKKLGNLEEKIKTRVIGQEEAVKLVAAAIKRSRVQISPRRRPASFIFVGPTGVGKTELVKVLSTELFDSPETLIRIDMSEFMEKHAISSIIGSPPGYVGYDESGQVTEKVRRRPYSIVLFDEIEKAHPDVMNILLQILDEGKVNDSHGRTVDFTNTVIVMTSNAGSDKKDGALGFAKSTQELSKEKALKALSDFLRPEFISRIDEVVVFRNLTSEDFEKIAILMLKEYAGVLFERGIKLSYDENVPKRLAEKSTGGKSGARDLRNLMRKEVEDKFASVLVDHADEVIKSFHISADEDIHLKYK